MYCSSSTAGVRAVGTRKNAREARWWRTEEGRGVAEDICMYLSQCESIWVGVCEIGKMCNASEGRRSGTTMSANFVNQQLGCGGKKKKNFVRVNYVLYAAFPPPIQHAAHSLYVTRYWKASPTMPWELRLLLAQRQAADKRASRK